MKKSNIFYNGNYKFVVKYTLKSENSKLAKAQLREKNKSLSINKKNKFIKKF